MFIKLLFGVATVAAVPPASPLVGDNGLLYIRWKYQCPEGYAHLSPSNSEYPSQECEQAAAFLGLPHMVANTTSFRGSDKKGCCLQESSLFYVDPGTGDDTHTGSDVLLVCKREDREAGTEAPQLFPRCEDGGGSSAALVISALTLAYLVFVLPFVLNCLARFSSEFSDPLSVRTPSSPESETPKSSQPKRRRQHRYGGGYEMCRTGKDYSGVSLPERPEAASPLSPVDDVSPHMTSSFAHILTNSSSGNGSSGGAGRDHPAAPLTGHTSNNNTVANSSFSPSSNNNQDLPVRLYPRTG